MPESLTPETPPPIPNLERRISASLLRLRMKSPFFAALALFARFKPSLELPTAATDGRDVFYNPHFMGALPDPEFDGVMLHEVLHAALVHVPRRSRRDPQGWNIAADIVVNGILMQHGFSLPEGHIRRVELEHYSVEEVFALLPVERQEQPQLTFADLLEEAPSDAAEGEAGGGKQEAKDGKKGKKFQGKKLSEGDSMSEAERAQMEKHWKQAVQQAQAVARSLGKGSMPAGLARAFGLVDVPQLDWKSVLWRFLVRTPTDFGAYDRRHMGRGLYLEALEGENLRVYICVDTSGSVDDAQVKLFMGEVLGILRAYPHLEAQLYYADAAVYGPYSLKEEIPAPQGGGGTDFRPFFAAVSETHEPHLGGVCVYLTDGFGDFPAEAPELPTLWVVSPGGLDAENFPFGEAVKLL